MHRALLLLALWACSSPSSTIVIHAPADLAAGTEVAATDLVADLGRTSGRAIERSSANDVDCVDGETRILLLGHEHGRDGRRTPTKLAAQEYWIDEERCDDGGRLVVLRGGSLLAAQWAVYDLLERLGVRYFHPEQTLYPAELAWPKDALRVHEAPDMERRSLHAHRTHPIELSPPNDASPIQSAGYQRRWVDWNVKVRHTELDGFDDALIGTYAYDRGFPRRVGINLLNGQQGGRPVLDADDPRPESVQIAEAIDEQMAEVDGKPAPSNFTFQFNPNEFTTADEQLTVDRITFVTEYLAQRWPDTEVRTINHGTAQGPGANFGVRFFDLSKFAPARLAVEAHTLMFYDLERPAPVYGNTNFQFMRDFIIAEQAHRRVYTYPESSWWLTFDLPVPLFLAPVSLEARDHDLQLLRPYVGEAGSDHGVAGHLTFSSGQEWGYWLIDYCTARMTWDLDLGWIGCLDHVAGAFAEGDALRDLIVEVGRAQVAPLRDPAILAMLVGSDDETEAAELAGIEFHPLPPRPSSVLAWSDTQAAEFTAASLAPLPAMAADYARWADAAAEIAAQQSDDHAPWVSEVADGLRVTGLRLEHARAIYDGALAIRTAIAARDFAGVQAAQVHLDAARALTEKARVVVTAREGHYRYPRALTIDGDEPGTPGAVPNSTIYPYRYLSRTHRLFYWTRPDEQLATMFGTDTVAVSDRIVLAGTALVVELIADAVSDLAIAWGDGTTATTLAPHVYAAQGVYEWTLSALHSLGAINHVDRIAVVARRLNFARGALTITAPQGAGLIMGLLPGLAIGLGTDTQGEFMAIGELGATTVVQRGTVRRTARTGGVGAALDLDVALTNVGTATVFGAVATVSDGAGPTDRRLRLTGELSTEQIIQLIVATGGFDQQGARDVVAAQLGYTPETLPARVAFVIEAVGSEAL